MAASLFIPPSKALDANANPYAGAKWFFYTSGTTTPLSVFTTAALDVAHANPVVADSSGKFPNIFFDASLAYRGILKNADESVTLHDIDPVNDGSLAELAENTGAALIGTTSGNVQTDINAAKARLTAIETVTPTGEDAAIPLADALLTVQAGPRDTLYYNAAQQVRITRRHAVMAGFRFGGQYSRGRAPAFTLATQIADLVTMKGAESTTKAEAWYAVFACADNGDATAVLRLMPYLRLGTPSAGRFPTVKGGEGFNYTADADYAAAVDHAWTSSDNLVGTQALIISENGGWSGRITTVTMNDPNEISFAVPGALTKGDFVLVAPPGFDHFVWLADFYRDTGEVRNIYDSGFITKGKMINVLKSLDGTDVATGEYSPGANSKFIDLRGYISPLATMGIIDTSLVLSSASTGNYAEYYDGDGAAHVFDTRAYQKNSTTSETVIFSNIQIPFLYHQSFDYSNAGSMVATRTSGQFNVTGWAVP